MDSIARFFTKAGMLLRREKFNSELAEEMSFHREQKEKELREAGVAPEAAHHEAALEFGNPTRLKEQSYEVIGFRFETVWQDLHFALRQLRRSLGFTLTAILMLALGIGANAAIYSLFNQILLRPLPVPHPDRLVNLAAPGPQNGTNSCNQAGDCWRVHQRYAYGAAAPITYYNSDWYDAHHNDANIHWRDDPRDDRGYYVGSEWHADPAGRAVASVAPRR